MSLAHTNKHIAIMYIGLYKCTSLDGKNIHKVLCTNVLCTNAYVLYEGKAWDIPGAFLCQYTRAIGPNLQQIIF